MASIAADTVIPNSAPAAAPSSNAPATGGASGKVNAFATMLAQLGQPPRAAANDAANGTANTKGATKPKFALLASQHAAKAPKAQTADVSATPDAALLANGAAVAPPVPAQAAAIPVDGQPKTDSSKSSDAAAPDAATDAAKDLQIAQLQAPQIADAAAAAQPAAQGDAKSAVETPPAAGTATDPAAAASAEQADALTQIAAQSVRDFTNTQVSTAHALSVHLNAAAAKNAAGAADTNSSGTNSQSQSNTSSNGAKQQVAAAPSREAATSLPPEPQPVANAPVPQQSAPHANNTSLPGIAQATAPVAAAPVSASLQIAAQTAQDPQPNLSALAVAIATKSEGGAKHFDIRMDPPELGKIDVHLAMGDDGKVQASLAVEKPQTLALLQHDSQNLERALKDSGLDLSNNGLNFSLKGQDRQNGDSGAAPARTRDLSVNAVASSDQASTSTMSLAGDSVRLDIRV